ncbi:probable LRR receptor-like serine/threonine-protein kinase At3g47570 [Cornus florida]|uniref:probable LRR receptor-like serine/threonine-protein kinase At3g47570 n=1 Tax=Cornus florida TaxID=4283 RepID=UPI002896972A|nr:probable LRR receptor-like serine/threonine-protein kinase At3g47570 [Cornus florida]
MSMGIYQLFVPYAAVLLLCICMPLLHSASPTTTIFEGHERDRLALLAIKAKMTDDPMLITSSWNDSLHFCQWHGVSCGHRHQRVTILNLQSCNLVGSISPSIGNLSFLRIINLSNNTIHGGIPHEIGFLFRLQILNLANNSLEKQIPPSLSHCSNLRVLDIGYNKLIGKIPVELGSLSKLVRLHILSNNLTGAIPPSFGNLSSLEALRMGNNMLEGSIPDSLGQLKSLTLIVLMGNELSGKIPPSIYNISTLAMFIAADNQLEGSLPQNLALTLPNLRWFYIWGNKIIGSIPVSLSNASNLEVLDISENRFSGGMPIKFGKLKDLYWLSMDNILKRSKKANDLNFISSLTNCTKLRILFLGDNNFVGVLPSSIANLSNKLQYFGVGGNEISGNIPTGIGNLQNLWSLDMEGNQLEGSIPTSIGLLHKLQEMGVGKNKLSGEIPSSIGNLTLLNQLWLEENKFQGSIPSALGNCKSLILLHLYGNNLSGTIPSEVIGLSSLTKSLNLSQNGLSSPLPLEVANLKNLGELNVSHNELSGEIPTSLGSCSSLEHLLMDCNSFEGLIPGSLSSLTAVEELDLSHNKLSGEIPKDLGNLRLLRILNLSFNDLKGKVPTRGVFDNASAISIYGNTKLCGGIPALQLPVCSADKPGKKKTSLILKAIIPTACGVLGIILLSSFLLLVKKRKQHQPSSVFELMQPFLNVTYGQLLKATDGFKSTNLIGMGSFGSVYKGILDPSGIAIAVKVLNLQHGGASGSFMAECQVLRNIRHRNLLKILTACSSIDFHGNDFKALVYEFMPNGSLETWLHPVLQTSDVPGQEPKRLNLLQRLNVAIDVASALDYLHNHCQIPIVHCDLKPSNILLDSDMTACLGDFGLARFLQQHNNESSQNQTSSMGIKGTIGYAAPDGFNLHKFAKTALPEQATEIVDQMLGMDEEEAILASSSSRT